MIALRKCLRLADPENVVGLLISFSGPWRHNWFGIGSVTARVPLRLVQLASVGRRGLQDIPIFPTRPCGIYLMLCNGCRKDYIGATGKVPSVRVKEPWMALRKATSSPLRENTVFNATKLRCWSSPCRSLCQKAIYRLVAQSRHLGWQLGTSRSTGRRIV